jgi:autotransporter strand-loop-strand O-heptosyltransferase
MLQIKGHASYFGKTGYNIYSQGFFKALNQICPKLSVRSFTPFEELYVDDKNDDIINIVLNETNHPYFYENYSGIKIAYNLWETTQQPPNFFNRLLDFDQLWVPSEWQKEMILKQGYPPNKVFVIPGGVDTEFIPVSKNDNNILRFLVIGAWGFRKSTKEIIESFLHTFNNKENVELWLSVDAPFSKDGMYSTEERLKFYKIDDKRIKIKHFTDRESYIKMVQNCDVFLSCSRGEGWFMPLIEALACGKPAIFSNCSGQLEFASNYPLKVNILKEIPAICKDERVDFTGNYYEPDFNHLEKVLLDVYNNFSYYAKLHTKLSKKLKNNFSWNNSAKKALNLLMPLMFKDIENKQNLLLTFKGSILPIIDKNDTFCFFIRNDCGYEIKLDIIDSSSNNAVCVKGKSTKLVPYRKYTKDIKTNIFYNDKLIFNFDGDSIEKSMLSLFSNYIIRNDTNINRISFSLSFLDGIEITALSNKSQNYFLKIVDKDNNVVIHENNFVSGEPYIFKKSYYINYEMYIFNSNGKIIYHYSLDLTGKKVWIKIESKALGDTLAWIPYVEEFRKKHNCEVLCTTYWNNLFISQYPYISFVSPVDIIEGKDLFAIYKIQCSIPHNSIEMPVDFRDVGLQEMASKCLGLDYREIKPLVITDNSNLCGLTDNFDILNEKYVVISTMSTLKAKLWNNQSGWQKIIDYLVSKGLKVVLLQKEQNNNLKNVINMSGNNNIFKSIQVLKHCKFFIGLSSGLSWLAWSLNKKVVMISGFTDPKVEFKENNYRVINKSVCHGCWNDKEYLFDRSDWFWCPRHKNFECTTAIEPEMVINEINEILDIKDI